MTRSKMSSVQKQPLSFPLASFKVFDLANPNVDPLVRLRQFDSFGQEETSYLQKYQDSVLAVASAFVPVNHPFLESIKSAPLQPSDMDIQTSEQPSRQTTDIDMMSYIALPPSPGCDEQVQPNADDFLDHASWLGSNTPAQVSNGVSMPPSDWTHSTPSASHSSSTNESRGLTNIPHLNTVSSSGGRMWGLGTVPPALQTLIDRTLVGDKRKHLSLAEIHALASDTRKAPNWTNYDRNLIIEGIFGLTRVVPDDSTIPVDTPFSVRGKPEDLPTDWLMVSQHTFGGRRGPFPIAQNYGKMLKIYCHLGLMFADHEQSLPVPIFLQRVYGGMSSLPDGTIPGVPASSEELLAFIEGGEESWLATMYSRLHSDPRMKDTYSKLRNKTIKASAGSILSSSSRSTLPLPRRSTPALSAVHLPPDNQHRSLDLYSSTDTDNGGPPVDQNINAVADLLRNHHVITATNLQESKARASYLLRVVEKMRLELIESIHALRDKQIKDKYDKCMKIMENPVLDDEIKTDAKKFLLAYINEELGRIDAQAIIRELGAELPSLEKITNVFYHAPLLDPSNAATIQAASLPVASTVAPINAPAAPAPAANV
ncbi:hypothetical protein RhiLY_10227 [Ceratobasidium sp. AG-Ba]|nr:hypothetical protein RhiLY_10227 [Ceratobasidium sp. AG-Ba]